MPVYRLSLWSADLSRCVRCELGGDGAATLLERFEAAGRCALKLAAGGPRGAASAIGLRRPT